MRKSSKPLLTFSREVLSGSLSDLRWSFLPSSGRPEPPRPSTEINRVVLNPIANAAQALHDVASENGCGLEGGGREPSRTGAPRGRMFGSMCLETRQKRPFGRDPPRTGTLALATGPPGRGQGGPCAPATIPLPWAGLVSLPTPGCPLLQPPHPETIRPRPVQNTFRSAA